MNPLNLSSNLINKSQPFSIRAIEPKDNDLICTIIHTVMPEFGAIGPGFAIQDAEVVAMHAAYIKPGFAYFVVERESNVEGGGGIAPLIGGDPAFCELRKMYFLKSLRGLGAGQALMTLCLETARAIGYQYCYLETLSHMDAARKLYEKNGFQQISKPLGNTGHFGCNYFYLLKL